MVCHQAAPSPSPEGISMGFLLQPDAIMEKEGESSHERLKIYSEEIFPRKFRVPPPYRQFEL